MAHRRVREVMTRDVACAHEDTPFKDIVQILADRGISALPVLDKQDRMAGLVSEVDLLRKEEYQQDGKRPPRWWHWHDRAKAAGATARDVMTSPAITVGPDVTVVEAARSLHSHHIKRMPVVDEDNRLVGICSQRDLLRVFLRSDEDIRDEIRSDVLGTLLATNLGTVQVDVTAGVVTLSGEAGTKSMIPIAVRLSQAVDGVVEVIDRLGFAIDDTPRPAHPSLSDVQDARFVPPQPKGPEIFAPRHFPPDLTP